MFTVTIQSACPSSSQALTQDCCVWVPNTTKNVDILRSSSQHSFSLPFSLSLSLSISLSLSLSHVHTILKKKSILKVDKKRILFLCGFCISSTFLRQSFRSLEVCCDILVAKQNVWEKFWVNNQHALPIWFFPRPLEFETQVKRVF